MTRVYFNNSREPYTLIVAGRKFHVVTDAADLDFCYFNTKDITFDRIAQQMCRRALVSEDGLQRMSSIDETASYNQGTAAKMTLHDAIIHNIRLQALPGRHFDEFMHGKVEAGILRSLDFFESALPENPAILHRGAQEVIVSLKALSEHLFIRELTEAFHGKSIWTAAPDLPATFIRWEDTNWKYLYGLPDFLSKDMVQARENLVGAFARYFQTNREERHDASFFVKATEDALASAGMSGDDSARIFTMHYWA